jgi:hypothetical protein
VEEEAAAATMAFFWAGNNVDSALWLVIPGWDLMVKSTTQCIFGFSLFGRIFV